MVHLFSTDVHTIFLRKPHYLLNGAFVFFAANEITRFFPNIIELKMEKSNYIVNFLYQLLYNDCKIIC